MRALSVLLLVVGALAATAPAASAGTYTVHSCRAPDGTFVGVDGWTGGLAFEQGTTCLQPLAQFPDARFFGIFTPSNSGGRVNELGVYAFTAPANTRIARYRLWRSTQVSSKSQNGSRWATAIFEAEAALDFGRLVDVCIGTEGCTGRGTIDRPLDPANVFDGPQTAGVTRTIAVSSGCSVSDCPPDAAQANFQVHRADVTLDDASAPTFSAPPSGGLLATDRVLTGPETVTVPVRDLGSGVERAALEIDGEVVVDQVVDSNDGGCRRPFVRVVPCRLEAQGTLSYDPAQLADGAHRVRVLAVDAAGNATGSEPVTITTRRPLTACGPTAPGPAVAAAFSRGRRTVRLRRTTTTRLTGRLTDGGRPLGGAPIRLVSREDRTGAPVGSTDGVTTGADGRFSLRVPAGASRRLRVAYRAGRESTLRCSRLLRTVVPAPVTLTLARRSLRAPATLRISGRLPAGPIPARGKLVDLQARDRGKWRTFDTTRAREGSGRFTARLRFGARARRGTYPIRARVRREGSYPYALGYSRARTLRLR